jgi:hypothetical protein
LSSSKKLAIAVPDDLSNFCQSEHCGQAFVPMELLCKALEKAPYEHPFTTRLLILFHFSAGCNKMYS